MKILTKIFFTCAIVGSIYCSYRQGVINERNRWQKIYFCEYDAKSDARLCMKNENAIIQFNAKPQTVVPPSNIRAKVK